MDGDPVGEVIAQRYELRAVIGRGGQGVVCRALDRETGHEVAVKVIEARVARSPEVIERMAREQQALVALAGTHAVHFLDMCTSDSGALCLVMELLEGQEFERALVDLENQGERLSTARLVQVLEPIVTTLDRAHSVGIVHRDLKPGNIFLLSERRGGGARLLDFGFARLSDSKRVTNTGMVMGSPSYIAPEMWKGQGKEADHRVDVYAFGVIVFRALAGQLPFANSSMQETLISVTRAKRPSLHQLRPDLPAKVDHWVEGALAIEAEDRFPSVGTSWEQLLWALDLGPKPGPTRTGWTQPPPDIGKIREWLEEPVSDRSGSAQSVWAMAATAFKRLIGRGTEPPPPVAVKPVPITAVRAKLPTSPRPVPVRRKAPRPSEAQPAGGGARHQPTLLDLRAAVSIADIDVKDYTSALITLNATPEQGPRGKRQRAVGKQAQPRARKKRAPAKDATAGELQARPGKAKPAAPAKLGKPKWKSRRHKKRK
jgi:serine/threonine-protein kinase